MAFELSRMKNHVGYGLTKTIPGPRIKAGSAEEGIVILMDWMKEHAIAAFDFIKLQLTIPQGNFPDLQFLDDQFKNIGSDGWVDSDFRCWQLVPAVLHELLEMIRVKRMFFLHYNYEIIISLHLILLDDGQLMKGQDLLSVDSCSSILAFVRDREISIEPRFRFPFPEDNTEFRTYYEKFKFSFPFRMNDKNLYLVMAKPGGGSSYKRIKGI